MKFVGTTEIRCIGNSKFDFDEIREYLKDLEKECVKKGYIWFYRNNLRMVGIKE